METQIIAETMITEAENPTQMSTRKSSKGKSRRMKLLERMGCFGALPENITISRAVSAEELVESFKMVHDSYIELRYMLPQPSGLRIRLFDTTPDTATFIAREGDKIIGVTSIVIDSQEMGLPSDKAFRQENNELRRAGRKVCEGTNWFIVPEYRRTPVMTELMRCCFAYAMFRGCTDMVAEVSPTHRAFYEIMAFENIGSERNSCPDPEIDDPVVLMNLTIKETVQQVAHLKADDNCDLAYVKVFYIDENVYHDRMKAWQTQAQESFSDPDFLFELFEEKSGFLADCGEKERDIISNLWGEELYQDVQSRENLCLTTYSVPDLKFTTSLMAVLTQRRIA